VGEKLGMPAATLSFHLKELKNAGIVACERRGRSRIYRPEFDAMNALVAYLMENCCQGAAGCGPRTKTPARGVRARKKR
jgi:DNA-binding transcriptional ArsR family regulator